MPIKAVPRSFLATPQNIEDAIFRLKNNKAPGPDGIDNLMLKNISRKALVQITHIVNAIFKQQYYPMANIIPILKQGKSRKEVDSYRPIS